MIPPPHLIPTTGAASWTALTVVIGGAGFVSAAMCLGVLLFRRQHRELLLFRNRYRNLLENTHEQMWCIEFDEPISLDLCEAEQVERIFRGRIVEANAAFAAGYGASLKDVLSWRVEDFLPREFAQSEPTLKKLVRSGYEIQHVESKERTPSGETKIFDNNVIGTKKNNQVIRIWGVSRDVTAIHEAKTQLALRQTAIDNSTDGYLITDAIDDSFAILHASEGFLRQTGYSASEVLGRNCKFLHGEKTDPETIDRIRQALENREPFRGEILNYRKNGTCYWNLLRIVPVQDSTGRVDHFVGTQTDITQQKRDRESALEQRAQLDQVSRAATLVEIGAALAHELKQPLSAILRNAQAAKRYLASPTPPVEEIGQILDDIVNDDRRAGMLLDRIRQHLNRQPSERILVDVNKVIQNALSLMHSELIIKHTRVDLKLDSRHPMVLADPIELQQVILNLILNAKEAMRVFESDELRSVTITTDAEEHFVSIRVRDTGPGIDEQDIDQIFAPFHTTKEDGMGVGLAISQRAVESFDGTLKARNVSSGGAEFVIELPIAHHEVSVHA